MNPSEYSEEQKKDISERVAKAHKFLEELNLHPAASVSVVNLGDDVFAQKVVSYLQDDKYSSKLSPIQDV